MKYLSENIIMKFDWEQPFEKSRVFTDVYLEPVRDYIDLTNLIFRGNIYVTPGSRTFPFHVSDLVRDYYKAHNNGFDNYFDCDIYGELPSTGDAHQQTSGVGNWRKVNDIYVGEVMLNVYETPDISSAAIMPVFPGNLPIGEKHSTIIKDIAFQQGQVIEYQKPLSIPLNALYDYTLIPRIPNKSTKKMFVSTAWYSNQKFIDGIAAGDDNISCNYKGSSTAIHNDPFDPSAGVSYFTVSLEDLLFEYNIPDETGTSVQVQLSSGTDNRRRVLFEIDPSKNMSEYYVAWLDDSYVFQCQPFRGKSIISEDYEKKTTVDSMDITRTQYIDIEKKWSLTSDYLTDIEYRYYNSILRSPYIYLYNTKLDEGYYCEIEDKQATNKTYVNDGMKFFAIKLRQRNKERM